MATPAGNMERHRDLVDEGEVLRLLEGVQTMPTPDEDERLRDCVRRALEAQSEAAQIMAGIARRNSEDDAGEANVREALSRWHARRLFEALIEEANAQAAAAS